MRSCWPHSKKVLKNKERRHIPRHRSPFNCGYHWPHLAQMSNTIFKNVMNSRLLGEIGIHKFIFPEIRHKGIYDTDFKYITELQ